MKLRYQNITSIQIVLNLAFNNNNNLKTSKMKKTLKEILKKRSKQKEISQPKRNFYKV